MRRTINRAFKYSNIFFNFFRFSYCGCFFRKKSSIYQWHHYLSILYVWIYVCMCLILHFNFVRETIFWVLLLIKKHIHFLVTLAEAIWKQKYKNEKKKNKLKTRICKKIIKNKTNKNNFNFVMYIKYVIAVVVLIVVKGLSLSASYH